MTKKFYVVLILLFALLTLGLGSWGLTESSEARYAEIGREMAMSNDFIHPSLLGIGHYHKPPITYAITAIGYKVFGFNEFGARFFMSLALILQLLLIFKIGRLWFKDEKIGIAAALIYFSFPIALIAARNLTTDAYLATFIIWSIYLWLQVKVNNKKAYLYLFYIALGLGFLTKGPVAFLPTALFILCYKIIYKEKPKLSIHSISGLILLLVLSVSWFATIVAEKPALWDYFIQEQIIARTVAAETFHRAKPIWFYLVFAPLLCLPWLVPIVLNLYKEKSIISLNRETKTCGYSALAILITYSLFSSKLILYILPLYPVLALFFGTIFIKHSETSKKIYLISFKGAYILLGLIIIALIIMPMISFNIWLALFLLISALTTAYYLFYKSAFAFRFKILTLSTVAYCFVIIIHTSFSAQNSFVINSPKPQYEFIKTERADTDYKVLIYDNLLSSAPFYLDERIITIYDTNFEAKRDTRFEKTDVWKQSYLPLNEEGQMKRLKELLNDKNNVLLIKTKKSLPEELTYLLEKFKSKEFKKWTVYY
ncbi:ArnT family glycosyltransferase [Leeuwenhoekiella marinoflava]|uniref:ArnT family glycosyltransferase n=1 Tax=Leeuwenhoekiella marinoflava TaxID=988 RepID=UPI003001F2C4